MASQPVDAMTGDLQSLGVQGIAAILSLGILVFCVVIHYEVLRLLSRTLVAYLHNLRLKIVSMILGIIFLHLLEILIFAAAFMVMDGKPHQGHLSGVGGGYLDYVYFSLVTYTTLGYGDIVPVGHIRFLTAVEALGGIVLIAWSAAYTFLKMRSLWGQDEILPDRSGKVEL